MKIAFLTSEYPHPKTGRSGGIGTSLVNLCNGLKALGHKVTIIIYGQPKDDYFESEDISFYSIKNVKVKWFSSYLTQKKLQRLINSLFNEHKIEIVEVPDWTGFSAFINSNYPLVVRLHGSDTYFCHLENRNVKLKNKFLEKRALKKSDGIISVSDYTGKLTNKLFGLKMAFTVIPNGIDISKFEPLPSNNKKQKLFYFGTLIRKKGVFELASIFNQVLEKNNNVELLLVGKDSSDALTGSNSTWQLMQSLFSNEALKNVNYLGPVDYSKIPNLINSANVCVFPTFAEALPVSWLEAMVMEKAIVASNIGWANEMIEDGKEGFLVHPLDHKTYANRILQLLSSKEKCDAFGKAARTKVKTKFSNALVAKHSVEFYNEIIKRKT